MLCVAEESNCEYLSQWWQQFNVAHVKDKMDLLKYTFSNYITQLDLLVALVSQSDPTFPKNQGFIQAPLGGN